MELRKDDKVIDGITVKTQQFPAMASARLFVKLIKTIGPALGALMKLDPETKLDTLGAETYGAFKDLDDEAIMALIPQILGGSQATTDDGKVLSLSTNSNIDIVFSGKSIKTMFTAVGFALQVNFRDFG